MRARVAAIIQGLAFVVIVAAMLGGWYASTATFREACEEIGGRPLWDGRQFQCGVGNGPGPAVSEQPLSTKAANIL